MTTTRPADIDTLVGKTRKIPEGHTFIEGKRLMEIARRLKIPYGTVRHRQIGHTWCWITDGIVIADKDLPRWNKDQTSKTS